MLAAMDVKLMYLIIILVIVILAWSNIKFMARDRKFGRPKPEQGSSRKSRIFESVMLLCLGLAIWLYYSLNSPSGENVELLDQFKSHSVASVLSLIGVLSASLIAARWSSIVGVVLCSVILTVYSSLVDVPNAWRARTVHFNLENRDMKGAELYVNGISLGELPVSLDRDEFLEKIPENGLPYEKDSSYQEIGISLEQGQKRTVCCQVKYKDQWCQSTRGWGGSGNGQQTHVRINFKCARYDNALEKLMDRARVKDYQVSEEWFDAAQTFGHDAISALLSMEPKEPGAGKLLDRWASLRFGLEEAQGEASAWRVFEKLCEKVTRDHAYSTQGLEGRAIVKLAPMLSLEKLTDLAVQNIRNTDVVIWRQWNAHKKHHFGMSYNGANFVNTSFVKVKWENQKAGWIPIKGFAVAHALWTLFEQGDSEAKASMQNRIMSEFLAKFYKKVSTYEFLCSVGGPVLEQFLLRQDWETYPTRSHLGPKLHNYGEEFNEWFYLLANLKTPEGARFRYKQSERLLQMADKEAPDVSLNKLEFLFLDPDKGTGSLAFQYWPRFLKKAMISEKPPMLFIDKVYDYLVKMASVASPAMYQQAFNAFSVSKHELKLVFNRLSLLPSGCKPGVYMAMKKAIKKDIRHLKIPGHQSIEQVKEELLDSLKSALGSNQEKATQQYEKLASGRIPENKTGWLKGLDEGYGVVPLLARSDRADLRKLALFAIESHPSKGHRTLLGQLLNDPDVEVATEAKAVKKKLDDLAKAPIETFSE